jgi:hypothetical protein
VIQKRKGKEKRTEKKRGRSSRKEKEKKRGRSSFLRRRVSGGGGLLGQEK